MDCRFERWILGKPYRARCEISLRSAPHIYARALEVPLLDMPFALCCVLSIRRFC